jgi:hypothetical protein
MVTDFLDGVEIREHDATKLIDDAIEEVPDGSLNL